MNNEQLQQLAEEKYPYPDEDYEVKPKNSSAKLRREGYVSGYADALKQNPWISVSQHDPLPEGNVLAYNGDEYMIGFLYVFGSEVCCDADMYMLHEVTHYQLLTPPKQ